jgi:2-polyprenyl-6-methoxyphenol hydroxylase-like FAD-dependent oxidoreductase
VHHDVVIAGGGPNGLLTACELVLAGVHPLVLERATAPLTSPKANGLVGTVVRAVDHRGLYERFAETLRPPEPVPHFQFGGLSLDLADLPNNGMYALPIPQRRMEALLTERALELGVEIRRSHEVTGFTQSPEEVAVRVTGPGGEHTLTTSFLVAADGGRSTIRRVSGIGFPGTTDEHITSTSGHVLVEPPFAVPGTGELDVPGVGRLRPATWNRTERGLVALGPAQPGVYRIAVQEWTPPADTHPTPLETLSAAVARVLGTEIPLVEPPGGIALAVRTGVNSRQADRYRAGRVFLVGDAAHVHSGFGGPGLNLGVQDALNLGWKLAAAVRGWAPEHLLDSYHDERHPVGERVLVQSRAQVALLRPGPDTTALREVVQELLRDEPARRRVSDLMSGAEVRYDARPLGEPHELTGRWLPDLPLMTADGPTRVAVLARSGRPLLLDLAGRHDLTGVAGGWSDRVDVITATTPAPPADVVLVRPDGHVAFAGADAEGLEHALRTWFGLPLLAAAL